MSLRSAPGLFAAAIATLICISCGQVYRPVVIPINTIPPNPSNFHAVFGVNANVPFNVGTTMQVDVSGDSDIGAANTGFNPTHAAVLPNNSRVFVASAGSLYPGDTDVITAFSPAIDNPGITGLGSPITFSLPNVGPPESSSIVSIQESGGTVTVTLSAAISDATAGGPIVIAGASNAGYDGNFVISTVSGATITYSDPSQGLPAGSGGTATVPIPVFCSYQPDFVATSQNTAVYVANFGAAQSGSNCSLASTDSVAMLNPVLNSITNLVYLRPSGTPPMGAHPIAMVESPNAQNLYVLNEGSKTDAIAPNILVLSPTDLSTLAPPIQVSSPPVWAVSRQDGQRVYVVTQGDNQASVGSQLYTISTATNALLATPPISLGQPGANFVIYDNSRDRLYVTNPGASALFVFDATTDPPTPIGTATGITISAPSPCSTGGACGSVMPSSVAALPDGSRFYVASYATATGTCPDPALSAAGCIIPQITVFDAATFAVKTTIFPLLAGPSATSASGFALAPVPFCAPVAPYTPAGARFRMAAAAAADGSKVLSSMCDGGTVAVITTATSTNSTGQNNAPDTLESDVVTPFSAAPAGANGQLPTQYPVFLLTGQ